MFCTNCGKQLVEGAKFCMHCGTAAPVLPSSDTPEAPSAPIAEPRMESVPTPEAKSDDIAAAEVVSDEATAPQTPIVETEPAEDAPTEEVNAETAADEANAEATADEANAEKATQDAPAAEENPADTPDQKPKKKKISAGKLVLIITVSVLVAAIVWIGAFFAFKAILSKKPVPSAPTEAYVVNGTAYIPYGEGKCYTIKGGVEQAFLTPDGERAVILYDDGSISYAETDDLDDKEKVYDADKDDEVTLDPYYITNEMFLFGVGESVYRYSFKLEEENIIYGSVTEGAYVALSSEANPQYFTCIYASSGKIYMLGRNDKEAKKISSYSSSHNITNLCASADGKTVVWCETNFNGGSATVYIWQNGDKSSLGALRFSDLHPYVNVYAGKNSEKAAIVTAEFSNILFVKKSGDRAIKVALPFDIFPNQIYGTDGTPITEHRTTDLEYGFFVMLFNENNEEAPFMLYLVDEEGNYKRLLTGCSDISFCGGKIIYCDAKGTVYATEFDAKETDLTEEVRIDSKIDDIHYLGSQSNRFYFYTITTGKNKGTLYAYDVKEDKTTEVASKVFTDDLLPTCMTSYDGNKIYYFTDVEYQAGEANVSGTLNVYDALTGKSQKIDEDVVTWSLTSSLPFEELDPNSIRYEVYVGENKESTAYYADLYYFNGKESSRIIEKLTIDF